MPTRQQHFEHIFSYIDEEKDLHSNKGEVILTLIARVYDTVKLSGWPAAMKAHDTELSMIAEMYRGLPACQL